MYTFQSQNFEGADHLDDIGVYGKTSVCFWLRWLKWGANFRELRVP